MSRKVLEIKKLKLDECRKVSSPIDVERIECPNINSYWFVRCLNDVDLSKLSCVQFKRITGILSEL